MRKDQTERLSELTENLMDVFLTEADPAIWTGSGMSPAEMDPQTRGARNWDMKNANQAGALVARALDLKERLVGVRAPHPPADDAADADIARFEKQAKKIIDGLAERQRGKA